MVLARLDIAPDQVPTPTTDQVPTATTGDVDGATRGAFVGVLEALSPQLLLGHELQSLNMDKYTMRPLLHNRHLLQHNTEVGSLPVSTG